MLDNLTTFGGRRLRFGRVTKDSISSKHACTFTRAKNACNGPFCEFAKLVQEGSSHSESTSLGGNGDIYGQAALILKGKIE